MAFPAIKFSHPARFAFAAIAAAIVAALVQMGSWREESERDLHKAELAALDDHQAAEAERAFLPDDFVRAAQVFEREREKNFARFEPILRAISEGGSAALKDEELRRRAGRLTEPQRVALVWMFFIPKDQRPAGIDVNLADALPCARALLTNGENVVAFQRVMDNPALLSRAPRDAPPASLNFSDQNNREALNAALQALLLNGRENTFHAFVVDFVESPPVKPLSLQRQLVLTKELEFLFLIGRGAKAMEPARTFLEGYYIRNQILRDKLNGRIDVYTKKAAQAAAKS